jgi:hypothetical protein
MVTCSSPSRTTTAHRVGAEGRHNLRLFALNAGAEMTIAVRASLDPASLTRLAAMLVAVQGVDTLAVPVFAPSRPASEKNSPRTM